MIRNVFIRIPTPHDRYGDAGRLIKQHIVRKGIDLYDPLAPHGLALACDVPRYDVEPQHWEHDELGFRIGCRVGCNPVTVLWVWGHVLVDYDPKRNAVLVSWLKARTKTKPVAFELSSPANLDAAARCVADCLAAWHKWAVSYARHLDASGHVNAAWLKALRA